MVMKGMGGEVLLTGAPHAISQLHGRHMVDAWLG